MTNRLGNTDWRVSGFVNNGRGGNSSEAHMQLIDTDGEGLSGFPINSTGFLYNDGTGNLAYQPSGSDVGSLTTNADAFLTISSAASTYKQGIKFLHSTETSGFFLLADDSVDRLRIGEYAGSTSETDVLVIDKVALSTNSCTTVHAPLSLDAQATDDSSANLDGDTRGIRLYSASNSLWGIYMAKSGANKSMGGGVATAGNDFSSWATRFRANDNTGGGFIFENSSEILLASINGGTGNAYFKGTAIASGLDINGNVDVSGTSTLHGNVNANDQLLGKGFRATGRGELHLRSVDSETECDLFFGYGSGDYVDDSGITWGISGRTETDKQLRFYRHAQGTTFVVAAQFLSTGTELLQTEQYFETTNVRPLDTNTYTLGDATRLYTAVYATNGTIQTSDYRLKTNIDYTFDALSVVSQLKPCKFDWIDPTAVKIDESDNTDAKQMSEYGFIAHEVDAVYPCAVNGKKDAVKTVDGVDTQVPQGLAYSKLIGLLTKAVQELSAEVAAIKSHVGI